MKKLSGCAILPTNTSSKLTIFPRDFPVSIWLIYYFKGKNRQKVGDDLSLQ
ncbi:MAG: hypothetical protein GY832_29840 [Chloroflexi bacterium]|nr:hypothetical protein [Chloroflexota bacterium]